MTNLRGCDVSTFQAPGLVPWEKYDFGIVRATYGTRRDKKTELHCARIRATENVLGLYHFFLPLQSIQAQFDAFCAAADAVKLAAGDLLPCIDIEAYPDKFLGQVATHFADVDPSWDKPLKEFVAKLEERFGGCILYITQRDWTFLGKPDWALARPLWVANYPRKGATSPLAAPATPGGRPYAIWQNLVGPLNKVLQDPENPAAVDQNVAIDPLPIIRPNATPVPPPEASVAVDSVPFVTLSDDDWDEMRAARDRHLKAE